MQDKIMWKCPNCETVNNDDMCIVCGEKKPLQEMLNNSYTPEDIYNSGKTAGYIEAQNKLSSQYNKKYKYMLFLILFCAAIIIAVFGYILCKFMSFEKDGSEISSYENINIMNTNAQIVYRSALDYCIRCISEGNSVADGIYCSSFIKQDTEIDFNGSFDDMKRFFGDKIGQDSTQYYCVVVKSGIPRVAFWGAEHLDGYMESITQKRIIENGLTIGIYPPYEEIGSLNAGNVFSEQDDQKIND